jgi:hypothetical protein
MRDRSVKEKSKIKEGKNPNLTKSLPVSRLGGLEGRLPQGGTYD